MIRNFLFHRVHPDRDPLWDPMDVKLFKKCINYISKNYTVDLFENIAFDDDVLNAKNKFASIMFDDGYKDNIEYALPTLEKYKVKASFYVVTECIDNNTPTWTHVLEYSFQKTRKQSLVLDFDFLSSEFQTSIFDSQESRITFAKRVKPYLKKLKHSQREQVIGAIKTQFFRC